jgi:DNA integrity scanning protein DisA with diadenylate cyclase activity
MLLQWNPRDEAWYLSLGKQNQDFLFKTKITTMTDLLKAHRALEVSPKGALIVLDTMKSYGRVTRNGWSSGNAMAFKIFENGIEVTNN